MVFNTLSVTTSAAQTFVCIKSNAYMIQHAHVFKCDCNIHKTYLKRTFSISCLKDVLTSSSIVRWNGVEIAGVKHQLYLFVFYDFLLS